MFGAAFILVENAHKGKPARINALTELTYPTVFMIGMFQLIAAVFPGTSRSGATIVGALLLGVSRTVAAESSLLIIRFLMGFVKKHDFKVFGWYRIILGIAVLAYFMLVK